jgi:putative MATE family efflux protein
MDRSNILGEEKIGKLLLKFSVPAIIGMLVNAFYSVIDRVFVGKGVGPEALSGIAISFPIPLIIMAFGMLIGIGGTSLISIRLGQQRKEDAEHIIGNSVTLLLVISVLISLITYLFMDGLLIQFGASSEVLPYARTFISVLLWGTVFQGIGFGMNNFIRAEGNPKVAMFTMILGAVLNIILNPIFIFIFKLGVAGSALATVISQMVVSIWVLYYFLGEQSSLKLRLRYLKLDKRIVKEIVAIGVSPFSMQIVASVVTVIFNKSLAFYGGDPAIAAMAVINGLVMMFFMPVFGINQGAQPIIGYNYGARKYDRVRKTLWLGIMGATGFMILGFLLTHFFPGGLMRLFTADEELIRIGIEGLKIYLVMLPIIGFQIAVVNYFQATGQPKKSLFLSLSRQLIFLIPALLIMPRFYGLQGVWMAGPVSDITSTVVTTILFFNDLKRLGRLEKEGELILA